MIAAGPGIDIFPKRSGSVWHIAEKSDNVFKMRLRGRFPDNRYCGFAPGRIYEAVFQAARRRARATQHRKRKRNTGIPLLRRALP